MKSSHFVSLNSASSGVNLPFWPPPLPARVGGSQAPAGLTGHPAGRSPPPRPAAHCPVPHAHCPDWHAPALLPPQHFSSGLWFEISYPFLHFSLPTPRRPLLLKLWFRNADKALKGTTGRQCGHRRDTEKQVFKFSFFLYVLHFLCFL